jgi:hypothetical protein
VLSQKKGLSLHLSCHGHEGLLTRGYCRIFFTPTRDRPVLSSRKSSSLYFSDFHEGSRQRPSYSTVRNGKKDVSVGLEFSSPGNRRVSQVGVLEYQTVGGQPVLSPKKKVSFLIFPAFLLFK